MAYVPVKRDEAEALRKKMKEDTVAVQELRRKGEEAAQPLDTRANNLEQTEQDLQNQSMMNAIEGVANRASLGLDGAAQFSDKTFDNSASRKLNTETAASLGTDIKARQVLSERLRAKAEAARAKPLDEMTKYNKLMSELTDTSTKELKNPMMLQEEGAKVDTAVRANEKGRETYQSDVDSTKKKNEADMATSDVTIKTAPEKVEQEGLRTSGMKSDNYGKVLGNKAASIRNSDAAFTSNQLKTDNDPNSNVNQILKTKISSSIVDLANKKFGDPNDPAQVEAKARYIEIAGRLEKAGMTQKDLKEVQAQFPELNLSYINTQSKLEAKATAQEEKDAKGKPLEGKVVDQINNIEGNIVNLNRLGDMKKLLSTGKIENVLANGKQYFNVDTPDMKTFKVEAGKMLADYMRSISGGAVPIGEETRLKALVPDPASSDSSFIAALDTFRREAINSRKRVLENYGKAGRNISGFDLNQFDDSKLDTQDANLKNGIGLEGPKPTSKFSPQPVPQPMPQPTNSVTAAPQTPVQDMSPTGIVPTVKTTKGAKVGDIIERGGGFYKFNGTKWDGM